ncbi:MAG: SDR family NAD(P)-dependent oxidoreductase [Proteobacteria bacterium]|nr:SDR family NAD(P)-dependent oxidoreductase [Pseudomonadota bacterium]
MRELRDRVAVVTGAGSGIGRALSEVLAEAGMHVVAADLDLADAEAAAEAVRARERRGLAVEVDVTDRGAVEELARRSYEAFGACHLLCNNAGVLVMGTALAPVPEQWDWVVDVNLRGVLHGVQCFVPRMLAQGGPAHIVNTASMAGLAPSPRVAAYTASKYAVVGFSECLRIDLEEHGIGVSVVCPGGVKSRLFEGRHRPSDAPVLSSDDLAAVARAGSPDSAVLIDPERVARAVLDGVRDGDLYIVTHPQMRDQVEARCRDLLAAFDKAAARQDAPA